MPAIQPGFLNCCSCFLDKDITSHFKVPNSAPNSVNFSSFVKRALPEYPGDARAVTLTNLDLVARWAGIEGSRDDDQTPRGGLFALLGVNGSEPPRILGVLPAADLDTTARQWRIPQTARAPAAAPPIAQLGQARIFTRTCRNLCGQLPHHLAPAAPPVAAPPAVAPPAAKKIKPATVINQTDDSEVDVSPRELRTRICPYGPLPPPHKERDEDAGPEVQWRRRDRPN